MKRLYSLSSALALSLLTLLAVTGCKKEEAPPPTPQKPAGTAPASAERTSFAQVTSQLDPGGNLYVYLSTEQWLAGVSGKVGAWRGALGAIPELASDDRDNLNKAFDIVNHVIKHSGIEDVTGLGMSSIEIEPGMFRNKALLHHYPGKGTGFIWQLGGKEPHPLTGLDFLPATTALAVFSDLDLPVLWSVIQKEAGQANLPQAQQWLQQLPAQFEKNTNVKWDTFINSLGGEFGLVITLDASNNMAVPLPTGAIQVPSPGLLLAVKVNDDTIFNRIDTQLKANPQIISVDKPGLKMRTMPIPIPIIGQLRASVASSGGYLLIATSDGLINEALAVKSGQTPGLKASDEFKHLAKGLPDQGNQFAFMSQRFAQLLTQVQQQVINANAQAQPQMAQWMQSLSRNQAAFNYSVGVNTPDGCLTVGNGSQSYANAVLLPAVAVPAMMAAIAIPNFVKARATAQENACINNLRQLDGAKNQWALEKGKTTGAVPTKEDLLPYLRIWPVCPQGGTYTIGPVGENPQCSIPGHALPR